MTNVISLFGVITTLAAITILSTSVAEGQNKPPFVLPDYTRAMQIEGGWRVIFVSDLSTLDIVGFDAKPENYEATVKSWQEDLVNKPRYENGNDYQTASNITETSHWEIGEDKAYYFTCSIHEQHRAGGDPRNFEFLRGLSWIGGSTVLFKYEYKKRDQSFDEVVNFLKNFKYKAN